MNAPFLTRNRAEAYLAANRTPAPAELRAFLANEPRPLPGIPTPPISDGLLKLALTGTGAVLLALLGWLLS